VAGFPPLDRYLFIEGGALAIENTLKAAMDWKVRKNMAAGRGERGTEILHFRRAFHGRSGYTMSLTNTDPRKTDLFAKFELAAGFESGDRFFPARKTSANAT
jgi:4-aminobutyrate aminotransferase and related aminotransferases